MSTRIRIREADDGSKEVVVLIEHPMHTGNQKNKETKKLIPAHYIQKIVLELNGKEVATVHSGPAVSADPLLAFRLKTAKNGDKVKISWWDNKKQTGSAVKTIDV